MCRSMRTMAASSPAVWCVRKTTNERTPHAATEHRLSLTEARPAQGSVDGPLAVPQWLLWAVALGVLFLWFGTLDARHLLRTDEGRYAEIAREMFASGDWVTIRYNGLKYFEKPPFHLWMTALSFQVFGVGEWQARLWGALCGAGGIALTMM